MDNKNRGFAYVEPSDYIPKELREKYKIGEFYDEADDVEKTNEPPKTEKKRMMQRKKMNEKNCTVQSGRSRMICVDL